MQLLSHINCPHCKCSIASYGFEKAGLNRILAFLGLLAKFCLILPPKTQQHPVAGTSLKAWTWTWRSQLPGSIYLNIIL